MKFCRLLLALLPLWGCWTSAQVTVELVLDQEQYLPSETVIVGVRITNLSGQPLKFGETADWLQFSVESRDQNFVVSKDREPSTEGEFILESSKVATRNVDIAPYFNLSRVGRYLIIATVKISQWNQEIVSQPKGFDIINGVRLWEQAFGVPPNSDDVSSGAPPEFRKYILQKATYLKQLRLYVRVTDMTEVKTFRVFPVEKVLSFSNPEAYVDRNSNLHLLNQVGPRSFIYCVVGTEGQLLVRQRHDYTQSSRPTLKVDDTGLVRVIGGARRLAVDDLPFGSTSKPNTMESPDSVNKPTSSTATNSENATAGDKKTKKRKK
jgi:hypothetical protein